MHELDGARGLSDSLALGQLVGDPERKGLSGARHYPTTGRWTHVDSPSGNTSQPLNWTPASSKLVSHAKWFAFAVAAPGTRVVATVVRIPVHGGPRPDASTERGSEYRNPSRQTNRSRRSRLEVLTAEGTLSRVDLHRIDSGEDFSDRIETNRRPALRGRVQTILGRITLLIFAGDSSLRGGEELFERARFELLSALADCGRYGQLMIQARVGVTFPLP